MTRSYLATAAACAAAAVAEIAGWAWLRQGKSV
ncbi:hypothetical protein MELB17_00735 [Marinobacter sp. ELB17]|nr:hypothetical protein MELB17_00735 [Marinobacter sp. ELB17]